MKKGRTSAAALILLALVFLLPKQSFAVPSFARQLQKPCTACHTVWPQLNQYGRQFKVKAYTDVSPDWQMINKDRLNLLYIFPISGRVIFYPYAHETDKEAGINSNTTQLNTVDLFLAGRIFDYAGIFGNFEATNPAVGSTQFVFDIPTIKGAFQYPLGEGNTAGLVVFKGLSTAADPFNSLGGIDRSLVFDTEAVPWILSKGWTFSYWSGSNVGFVAHGYFIGNRLYAAAGAERGGDAGDAGFGFSNDKNANPFDGYFRLAWDQKLANGSVTFGGAWYTGKERILTPALFQSTINRGYADAYIEQNFGEDHLVELQGLYGHGQETNAFGGGEKRKFDGFNVEGSYFYDRTIGLVADYNTINMEGVLSTDLASNPGSTLPTGVAGTDEKRKKTWLVGLNYLPWLNTKVALQYAQTKTKFAGGEPDETDKVFRVIFDILF